MSETGLHVTGVASREWGYNTRGELNSEEAAGNGSSKAGQAILPTYDGNGNLIRLTDSNGATVASCSYDGFGNRINSAASDIDSSGYANENRYGFSTKPRDPLTGLLYYGYRWYDPATGRWASRDPIGESGGLNLYAVNFNDCINRVDLFGLSPFSALAKQLAKLGLKKGMREFVEKNIKKRLQKHLTKDELKELAQKVEEILSTLDSSWWEVCIDVVPVIGDLYGTGKFAMKARNAFNKLQDLENQFVGKVSERLQRDARAKKEFTDKMRGKGVDDAKKDIKEQRRQMGTNEETEGRQGHHMDSVQTTPERMTDLRNIEFPEDHLEKHDGNWRNPTKSSGDIHRN